jgi:hypothetical protein
MSLTCVLLLFIGIFCVMFFAVGWYNKEIRHWTCKDLKNPEIFAKSFLFTVPIYFVANFWYQSFIHNGHKSPYDIDFEGHSNFTNYLILFTAVISAYYIYRTLNSQKKANQTSSFENRFFKFIDYHRENVEQLRYKSPDYKEEKYWKGNQVFEIINDEIKGLLREFIKNSHWNFSDKDKKRRAIDFVYQCVFYGANEDGIKILTERFGNENFQFINFKEKPAKYSNGFLSKGQPEYYYSGHARRLGEYFRNLYQVIQYVEGQIFIIPNEKYAYMEHLRAQMSIYEQSVFFFNSLSSLGESWEWGKYDQKVTTFDKKEVLPKLFMTKYDLVENTLDGNGTIVDNISIKDFYELVVLEKEEACTVWGTLPFVNNNIHICRFCLNKRYFGNGSGNIKQKITTVYQANKSKFDNFKCNEKNCETAKVLRKLRRKKKSDI